MANSSGADVLIGSEEPRDAAAAKKLFDQGRAAEEKGERLEAIAFYEQAFEAAPDDEAICFRLAYNLDLVGEEDEALHLYEQACADAPARVNALINLAVLYEDRDRFADAEKCLRQVVETDPNHPRAQLYLKDVQASRHMYVEEEGGRRPDRHPTMLETPIADFELTVRARNCLKKMNITTLGDLLRTTEAELMGYKNFGDNSLQEIKAMLAQRGMRLGQIADDKQADARQEAYEQLQGSGQADLLAQPVGELDLSVRARKALSLLDINTVGDLVARTEAELLGIKNFGSTSLQEIKDCLAAQGLSLRQLED